MKILTGIALSVCVAAGVQAQQVQVRTATDAKVIAEIAASSEKIVKGSPFSAEAVSESVQTLADGNRIVRKWSNKLYRNSEGRFRREGSGLPGSALGSYLSMEPSIAILDPVAGSNIILYPDSKTARTLRLQLPNTTLSSRVYVPASPEKVQAEIAAAAGSGQSVVTVPPSAPMPPTAPKIAVGEVFTAQAIGGGSGIGSGSGAGFGIVADRRTESLGVQNFDGVDAEGTRTVSTIPAGAIGNDRPIEIVYERWYSKELQLIVYSRHSDPRFGEQTYRLTNIDRSEPDPSLFAVPAGYTVITSPASVYRMAAPKAMTERAAPARVVTMPARPAKPQ
jgi:hypothetical protein